MQETRITIINKLGLHARAASKFVSTSMAFNADISVCSNEKWVDGKSIMSVMMLAASKGTEIQIRCTGDDEVQALAALQALINDRFGEGE